MMDIPGRAAELVAEIQAAILASDLAAKDLVTVDTDGNSVSTALSLAAGAVIVYPFPGLEWPAPKITRCTWSIAIIATPDNLGRVHQLLSVVMETGALKFGDRATPTDFQMPDNQSAIPGYSITHTEEHRS